LLSPVILKAEGIVCPLPVGARATLTNFRERPFCR